MLRLFLLISLILSFTLISCKRKDDAVKKEEPSKKSTEEVLTKKYFKDVELDFDDPMPRGKGDIKPDDLSKTEQWVFFYDKDKRFKKIEVRNAYGRLDDLHGFSQWMLEYDDKGRLTKTFFLDHFGKPIKNKRGVYSITYKYPDDTTRIEMYYDLDGELNA